MSDAAITICIAEAERRVDAMQSLCSVFLGQVKAERRQIEKIKGILAAPVPDHEQSGQAAPGDISPEMLG
jgi:hypothetical protein